MIIILIMRTALDLAIICEPLIHAKNIARSRIIPNELSNNLQPT